jgi:hypothetical protein
MRVNEAVVISLPERSERLDQLRAGLPMYWPFPALRVVQGVREDPPPWWRSSVGAWGCRQAHLKVLSSAWRRGVDSTLVLEDDAVFLPGFSEAWKDLHPRVPAPCSMLMLGGEHVVRPLPAGAHLVRCVNTRRTHAYIIKLKAIPLLMRTWSLSRQHIDHSSTEFQARSWTYAPTTFLVGQAAGWSDISDKENPAIRFWAATADS